MTEPPPDAHLDVEEPAARLPDLAVTVQELEQEEAELRSRLQSLDGR